MGKFISLWNLNYLIMRACKSLMSALFAILVASSAFGQKSILGVTADSSLPVLKRAGFRNLEIDNQRIPFAQANTFTNNPEIIRRLNHGLHLEKVAIGLGVGGAVAIAGGVSVFIFDDSWVFSLFFGVPLVAIGGSMGVTAIGLGIGGAAKISKTIRDYNYGLLSDNIESPLLVRRGLRRLGNGDSEFSFKEISNFIDDPEIARRIKAGVTQEILGLSLGVAGAAGMIAGAAAGLGGIVVIFAPLGAAGLILGINGAVITKSALNSYNNFSQKDSSLAELRLEFAPTPGGLGLQLTF
jgi:hypothetical protein